MKRYPTIAKFALDRVNELGLNRMDVARRIGRRAGCSDARITSHLNYLVGGWPYGTYSSKQFRTYRESHLSRLAWILVALEFRRDDPIVAELVEMDSAFEQYVERLEES